MVQTGATLGFEMHSANKVRFSVTLDRKTDDRLLALARKQRPPLSKQYMVQWAVERLLEAAEDDQLALPLPELR